MKAVDEILYDTVLHDQGQMEDAIHAALSMLYDLFEGTASGFMNQ